MSYSAHRDETKLIICSHIAEQGKPLFRVVHERDGRWQALCEQGAHDTVDQVRIACFDCFKDRHPEFEVISGLYRGGSATLIKDDPGRWWVEPLETEEK